MNHQTTGEALRELFECYWKHQLDSVRAGAEARVLAKMSEGKTEEEHNKKDEDKVDS